MILMLGATGELGGQVTRLLLERGHDVRAVVRSTEDADAMAARGARPIFADLRDYESLVAAARDTEVVVSTATAARRGGDDTIEAVDLDGNRNLIDAARVAGVRRFVFVSANGATIDHPAPLLRAKAITEERLRASGLDWTVVAPEPFMDAWLAMIVAGPALAGRDVVYVGGGRRQHSFVAIEDVARFVAAATDDGGAVGTRVVVGGPRPISFRQVAAVFAELLGRPVGEVVVAARAPVDGLSPAEAGMLAGLDAYDSPVDTTAIAERYGVRLTPVEEWARRLVPVGMGA